MKWILLFLVVCLAGCLGPHIRSPKNSVPFVREIGWWPYQEDLHVQKIEVQVLDSRLSLLNSRTLVAILITGEVKNLEGRRPVIAKMHRSEKVIRSTKGSSEAEISLTPIVEIKEDKLYDGRVLPFVLRQELILNSMSWGENVFGFSCGDAQQSVTVVQDK
ncbi:MAG: hypothetical protein IT443_01670 [Phycisphaeraceae bacterium]|nr:hypothetical protein [Phycisphaeraceae bacterium]